MLLKLVFAAMAAVIATTAISTAAQADDPSYLVAKQMFANLTPADAVAMGYVTDGVCVDAGELPPPVLQALGIPSTAGMGIHYVKEELFNSEVHGSEPEVLIFGPDGTLWSIEFESDADTQHTRVLGQEMPFLAAGHPGMEFGHYAMHAWMIKNPAGQFFDWNPAASCEGAAPITPPSTGDAGLLNQSTSSSTMLLVAGLITAAMLGAGVLYRVQR